MIRITLVYKREDGGHFDFDYYVNNHVEMSRRIMSDCGLLSIEVEKCIKTIDGKDPDFICISHVDFESEAGLVKALEEHGDEMMADFINYTNIDPEIHVCEILTSGV